MGETRALAATDALFQQFMQEPGNRWARSGNREAFRAAALVPAARGTLPCGARTGQSLWTLMAMVAALLLVACANVASLVIARAADRGGESRFDSALAQGGRG